MRRISTILILFLAFGARLGDPLARPSAQRESAPSQHSPTEIPSTLTDPYAPLDVAERTTLLRLAWRTLNGHLTDQPIKDEDLGAYDFTPRLMTKRGCWITLKKSGTIRGSQGEIEPTRPLYQQIIIFTRRAATRDARFVPLTELDLDGVSLEIAVIGRRLRVDGPKEIKLDTDGVFLEKWGRRAALLPGLAVAQGWTAERTLDELCRQASLPKGAWSQGAHIEVFTAETVAGGAPPAPSPSPSIDSPPGEGTPP